MTGILGTFIYIPNSVYDIDREKTIRNRSSSTVLPQASLSQPYNGTSSRHRHPSDFLHANQPVLDVGNQTLQLQQNNLEMALSGPPECSVLLRTCQPATLAPFAVTVFPVKCKTRNSVHKNGTTQSSQTASHS